MSRLSRTARAPRRLPRLRAGALLLVGVVLYGISRAGGVKPLKAEDYKVMDS